MEVKIINSTGKATTKKVNLNDAIYGIEPNDHAIYLDVKQYLANQRQGTHKAKQRNEISGSTRKLHKQKGTGGSRKGSIKSPLFRGGGRIFGPQPRDYSFKLNKKVKQLARKSALTYKAKNESLVVLEDFNYDAPKTKNFLEMLNNLKLSDKKTLVVLSESNKNIYLSSRNLQGSKVVIASELNTYDILNANFLVLTESSVEKIDNLLSK
jgi:large subunit ribosomal protein L4